MQALFNHQQPQEMPPQYTIRQAHKPIMDKLYIAIHLAMRLLQSNTDVLFFLQSHPQTMCRWYWQYYILCQHHAKKRLPCDMSRRLGWQCEEWTNAENEYQITSSSSGAKYTPAVMKQCRYCRMAGENHERPDANMAEG